MRQRFSMNEKDRTMQAQMTNHLAGHPDLIAYAGENLVDDVMVKKLLTFVDESAFSLIDWMNAFLELSNWLDHRALDLDWDNRINYVSCVAEAGASGMGLEDLSSMIREMLATYGCEQAVKKS